MYVKFTHGTQILGIELDLVFLGASDMTNFEIGYIEVTLGAHCLVV